MEKANGTNPMANLANYANGSSSSQAQQHMSDRRRQTTTNNATSGQLSQSPSFEQQFFSQPRHRVSRYENTKTNPLMEALTPPARQDWVSEFTADRSADSITSAGLSAPATRDFRMAIYHNLDFDGDEPNLRFAQPVWNERVWSEYTANSATLMYSDQNLDSNDEGVSPLLTTEESMRLQSFVDDTYGFNVNELLYNRHSSILDELSPAVANRLARDMDLIHNRPSVVWQENAAKFRAMIDNYLIYEGLVAYYLDKDLFNIAGKNLKEDDVDGVYIPDIIGERLRLLSTLQWGVVSQILTMSDQQLLDYVLQADYIPDTVLTTLYLWFFDEHKTVGASAITFQTNSANILHKLKVRATAIKEGRQKQQQQLFLYRPRVPRSDKELANMLMRRHLSYEALVQSLSPLELDEMKFGVSQAAIDRYSFMLPYSEEEHADGRYERSNTNSKRYGYLPHTLQELAEVVAAGDVKLYPVNQLEAIVKRLNLPLPAGYEQDHRQSKRREMLRQLLTNAVVGIEVKQEPDVVESQTSQSSNVKELSTKFMSAYKAGDYATVADILSQTNRLIVPLNFDLFSDYALNSKRDTITGLLIDKVQLGQLKLLNSASRLWVVNSTSPSIYQSTIIDNGN